LNEGVFGFLERRYQRHMEQNIGYTEDAWSKSGGGRLPLQEVKWNYLKRILVFQKGKLNFNAIVYK